MPRKEKITKVVLDEDGNPAEFEKDGIKYEV